MTYDDEFRRRAVAAFNAHRGAGPLSAVAAEFNIDPTTLRIWAGWMARPYEERPIAAWQPSPVPRDVDRLFRDIHGTRPGVLFAQNHLEPVMGHDAMAGLDPFLYLAATPGFRGDDGADTGLVVCCPDVALTYANPARLVSSFIADVVLAINVAQQSNRPCLIYLPVADHMVSHVRRSRAWPRFAEVAARLIDTMVEQMATPPRVDVVRTDATGVDLRLDLAAKEHAQHLNDVSDIMDLRRRTPRPQRAVTQRLHEWTIVRYLPDIAADLSDQPTPSHTIVVAELRNVRAAARANDIARTSGRRVEFLAHMCGPSLGGTVRMTRAPLDQAFPLGDRLGNLTKLDALSPTAAVWWQHFWDLHRSLLARPPGRTLKAMVHHYAALADNCLIG